MLAGYAVLHFVEHTIVGHLHFGEETHRDLMISRAASLSTLGGLFLHSFFDGFAIGAALQFQHALGILVFVAVLLHKVPEGLTIASVMLAARHSRRSALLASAAVGCATLLGVAAVPLIAGDSEVLLGYALAFSAGIATYVGATDLVPEVNSSENRIMPVVVFAGFLLLYAGRAVLAAVY
jgi:zinc transporter ZupT